MDSGQTIGLQAAAERLGVHYQTAYQWVRRGELPALQVGRQYVIALEDLDRFRQARESPAQPTSRVAREGFATALPRFLDALLAGDEAATRRITADYAETGTPITDIIEGLYAPSMRQIGEGWSNGDITIAVEHRASVIIEGLIASNLPRKRGRPRGRALVTTPPGDTHSLGALMATAALLDGGWKVQHLGPNLPLDEVIHFARTNDIGVIVLTSSTETSRQKAYEMIAELADLGLAAVTNEATARLSDLTAAVEAARE
ncbi:MAG: helix-turn-helix domain-containing protein [Actinomycetota bacterium]